MGKKTIMVRVADIIGNPDLEKSSGMTLEKYRTLVRTHGLQVARSRRVPVEIETDSGSGSDSRMGAFYK